jgi:hypothetical protein
MVEHAEQWRGRTPELVMVLAPGWAAPSFVFDERIAQSIPSDGTHWACQGYSLTPRPAGDPYVCANA